MRGRSTYSGSWASAATRSPRTGAPPAGSKPASPVNPSTRACFVLYRPYWRSRMRPESPQRGYPATLSATHRSLAEPFSGKSTETAHEIECCLIACCHAVRSSTSESLCEYFALQHTARRPPLLFACRYGHEPFLDWLVDMSNTSEIPLVQSLSYGENEDSYTCGTKPTTKPTNQPTDSASGLTRCRVAALHCLTLRFRRAQ